MGRSVISDPNHIKGKKKKNVTHLVNGSSLTPEMQRMVGYKDPIVIKDTDYHNTILKLIKALEDNAKYALYESDNLELYVIPAVTPTIIIYDYTDNTIWYTPDSNLKDILELYFNE